MGKVFSFSLLALVLSTTACHKDRSGTSSSVVEDLSTKKFTSTGLVTEEQVKRLNLEREHCKDTVDQRLGNTTLVYKMQVSGNKVRASSSGTETTSFFDVSKTSFKKKELFKINGHLSVLSGTYDSSRDLNSTGYYDCKLLENHSRTSPAPYSCDMSFNLGDRNSMYESGIWTMDDGTQIPVIRQTTTTKVGYYKCGGHNTVGGTETSILIESDDIPSAIDSCFKGSVYEYSVISKNGNELESSSHELVNLSKGH